MEFIYEFIGKGWRHIRVDCWGSNTRKIVRTLFKYFLYFMLSYVSLDADSSRPRSFSCYADYQDSEVLPVGFSYCCGSTIRISLLAGKMTDIHVPLESKCRSFKCHFLKEFDDFMICCWDCLVNHKWLLSWLGSRRLTAQVQDRSVWFEGGTSTGLLQCVSHDRCWEWALGMGRMGGNYHHTATPR